VSTILPEVGGPPHRGDGGDAEALVDLCAVRVVDPGHHVVDPEGLPGDARREDVRVVAVRDGREAVGVVDPGLPQHVAVEAQPGHLGPGEVGVEPAERVRVLVDHRDGVAVVLQRLGEGRAGPAAAHDHEVHNAERYTPTGA
jgi:hypothetical protein